jgi:glucose-6-phosphate dehydrogenase assembly protein OpcA
MGAVAEIERELARLRMRAAHDGGLPELRTSTMTHVVWAPPAWVDKARAVLAALEERHPARTILLVPCGGRRSRVEVAVRLYEGELHHLQREVVSEVIELRLHGDAARHPASIVLPLLISDLPAFCRWRGEPDWEGSAFRELTGVVDRLVVDSSEWRHVPASYDCLAGLYDQVAVSDIAYRRTLPWRARIAGLWPAVRNAGRLRVSGPKADGLLLAGWLRSRLRRDVSFSRRGAATVDAVWIDGAPVEPPSGDPPSPGALLSAELDVVVRDLVYEGAVAAVGAQA